VRETLLLDQYSRLLDALPGADPWPTLAESGFLDLLRPEAEGGAGLGLEDLFPLALETGRRVDPPAILETIAARAVRSEAIDVRDIEPICGRALAAVLAAGQMAGAMAEVERLTVDYALQRQQFGREIGKFQAVQHQIAVLAEEAMASRIAAQAAFVGPVGAVSETRAAVAKIRAGQAATLVCSIAHAVHGAIGVSAEFVLHHHTRRLRAWRLAHGGEGWWARRLGAAALASDADVTTIARGV
jgi:acyl-CoA dehydrogenase